MLMLYNILSKFLASLLVVVTLGMVASLIISQTIMNSEYMKQQLKDADVYARLSTALSSQIITDSNVAATPELTASVEDVITPEALQAKIDPTLEQAEAYYKGEGSPPQIEVADFVSQLQAAGVPIEANAETTEPIVLGPSNQQKKPITSNVNGVRTISIVCAIVLLVALALISWKSQRYKILPNVAIVCGVLLGIFGGLLLLGRGAADRFVHIEEGSNNYGEIAQDLAGAISHDIGMRYVIIAVTLLVIGIGARIFIKLAMPQPVARR